MTIVERGPNQRKIICRSCQQVLSAQSQEAHDKLRNKSQSHLVRVLQLDSTFTAFLNAGVDSVNLPGHELRTIARCPRIAVR